MWYFDMESINIHKEKELEPYEGINWEGKFVKIRKMELESILVVFSNVETIKIPMKIEEAKKNKEFEVQILYKLNNISPKTIEFVDFEHEKPTKYQFSDIKSYSYRIYVQYVGINIWDSDKNILIYTDIN